MPLGQKRKRDYARDDEEDQSYGMRQILPVANLPGDFTGEPMDGMQYLFMVRRDAQMLPSIKSVPNPYEQHSAAAIALDVQPNEEVDEVRTRILPSKEWQDIFLRRFRNFRTNAAQPTISLQRPSQVRLFPEKMNRDAWWSFLDGAPDSVWNPPDARKQNKQPRRRGRGKFTNNFDPSDASVLEAGWELVAPTSFDSAVASSPQFAPTDEGQALDPEDVSLDIAVHSSCPREPTTALLHCLDHRFALHLLMYFSHWITLHGESLERRDPAPEPRAILESHARWIFALLSRVDEFCTADEISTLRTLVRACLSFIRLRRSPAIHDGRDSVASTPGPEPEAPEVTCEAKSEPGEVEESKMSKLELAERSEYQEMSDTSVRLILCAVAGFWGQRDLWYDAEEVFSRIS